MVQSNAQHHFIAQWNTLPAGVSLLVCRDIGLWNFISNFRQSSCSPAAETNVFLRTSWSPDSCFVVFLVLCHPAMLQKWWKQQVGSPWWRLTHTWWPKLTAPWLQPSALFLDPHASASNNPNSLTVGHLHSYALTQAFTHNKPQCFTPDTQDKYSPCCYLLHLPTSCPKALQPHPFLLFLLFVNCEGKWRRHRKRRKWKSGAGGLVKWMLLFTRKSQPTPFFSVLALWGLTLCSFPCVR